MTEDDHSTPDCHSETCPELAEGRSVVLVYADGVEVPDELRGDGYLELLGVELDAVAGSRVIEIQGEGDIALMVLHHIHKVLTELAG